MPAIVIFADDLLSSKVFYARQRKVIFGESRRGGICGHDGQQLIRVMSRHNEAQVAGDWGLGQV